MSDSSLGIPADPLDPTLGRTAASCSEIADTSHAIPDNSLPHPDIYSPHRIVIEPRRGWRSLELAELWRYRHLLWMFMWRDIKAQEKQTVLGVLWIFIAPLASVAAMTVVFGGMLNVPSDGFPYPIFVFAGQFLWGLFSSSFGSVTNSVVGSSHFIQKVYFPRLLIPLSAATGGLVNICIVFPTVLAVMLAFGYIPSWTVIFCPVLIVLVLATALGAGLWLAPLNASFRDVGRMVTYGLTLGYYFTPVIYPISAIPLRIRWLAALNPMAGYIDAFRACLYGSPFDATLLMASVAFTLVVLVGGAFFYARLAGRFADVI